MNPTFFVFCEGKTEAAYVDLLRRSFRMPVEIIAKVSFIRCKPISCQVAVCKYHLVIFTVLHDGQA